MHLRFQPKRRLRRGEAVFHQRIVQGADDEGPGQSGEAVRGHFDGVAQDGRRPGLFDQFEAVDSVETLGFGEAKGDASPGRVFFNVVADRAVSAGGADTG